MPQFENGSDHFTVNEADDPAAGEDGFYVSQGSGDEKSTWTYDKDYNLIKQDGKKV